MFCYQCREELIWLREPMCRQCGRRTHSPSILCPSCHKNPSPLSHIAAAVAFGGPAREAIHQFKFEGMFGVAPVLAELMIAAWPAWASDVDLLCPIPLHHERERERGYNQSNLLVRSLQQQVGIESDFNALHRVKHTRPQIGLDKTERQDNVKGAFKAVRKRVAGRRILLVDDVCTSGATLTAAAIALLESGATMVSGYCLARPLIE